MAPPTDRNNGYLCTQRCLERVIEMNACFQPMSSNWSFLTSPDRNP